MPKTAKYYEHCNSRLLERYNIELTYAEFIKLVNSIRYPVINNPYKPKFLGRRSKRLSVWLVLVKNRWAVCFYDKYKHIIVTFLTLNDYLNKEVLDVISG